MLHMKSLTPFERRNLEYLVDRSIKFTQVQVTETGLRKSIMDATAPMRTFFKESGVHDYGRQLKGPDHKVLVRTHILTSSKDHLTKTSFYRPLTKDGDPRIWVYGLKDVTEADDIHVIIALSSDELYVIDITRVDISGACESSLASPIRDLIHRMAYEADGISRELLFLLNQYRSQWIETDLNADTAIGRQVESLLGIRMNGSPLPDYKGIELKSFRSQRPSIRKNLFCKVPDWDISFLKSAAEIVDKYGYISNGIKSYRNTLACSSPNTQNLRLNVNHSDGLLEIEEDRKEDEKFWKVSDVAVWRLRNLHSCLLTKHHETFWIEVDTKIGDEGKEQFMFSKIEHTKSPVVSQFDILLEQSMITVDLLLGRTRTDSVTGAVRKGGDSVIFKLKKNATGLLFPQTVTYHFK